MEIDRERKREREQRVLDCWRVARWMRGLAVIPSGGREKKNANQDRDFAAGWL